MRTGGDVCRFTGCPQKKPFQCFILLTMNPLLSYKPTKECISLGLRFMNELFWQSNQDSCVPKVTPTVFLPPSDLFTSFPLCISYEVLHACLDRLGIQNCLLAQVNERQYQWLFYFFCLQLQPMILQFLVSASSVPEESCFLPSPPPGS